MEKLPRPVRSLTLPLKVAIVVFLLALVFWGGIQVTRWYYGLGKMQSEEQSTVLLERIRSVAKLVVLEGYFSEIYDYKDYYGWDLSWFRKKALIRVKGKVLIGFDLDKMEIRTDAATRTVFMNAFPDPEILSLEHDIDYYDVQEGFFNSFTPQDYTRLNQNAKEFLRKQALNSDLFKHAIERRGEVEQTIRFLVESMGWKLVILSASEPANPAMDR